VDAIVRRNSAIAAESLLRSLGLQAGGPPAPGDETVGRVDFAFNTPSPVVLQAITAGQLLDRAAVLITTTFDDPAAYVEVGTSGDPDGVFEEGDIDLGVLGQYENRILLLFPSSDLLLLTIHPGASTQGAGILLYKIAL
jgi:hypothetical protein